MNIYIQHFVWHPIQHCAQNVCDRQLTFVLFPGPEFTIVYKFSLELLESAVSKGKMSE